MRHTRVLLASTLLALALACSLSIAQEEAPAAAEAPVTPMAPALTGDPVHVEFAGGTVRDLAVYMQELTGEGYAVMGAVDRTVQPLDIDLPSDRMLHEAVGAASRTARRPGWVLIEKDLAEPKQPTKLDAEDRELLPKRDLVEIGPIKADGVDLAVALKEVSSLVVMPILLDTVTAIEPFSVDVPRMPVDEFIRHLAEKTGLEAKPVQILFGLTPENLDEALKWVTDEEMVEQFDAQMGMFDRLPPEMQGMVAQWMYDEFRKLSDNERAGAVEFGGKFITALHNRFGAIPGADGARMTDRLGQMAGIGLDFYRSLPPGDRTELQPIAEIFMRIRGQ